MLGSDEIGAGPEPLRGDVASPPSGGVKVVREVGGRVVLRKEEGLATITQFLSVSKLQEGTKGNNILHH